MKSSRTERFLWFTQKCSRRVVKAARCVMLANHARWTVICQWNAERPLVRATYPLARMPMPVKIWISLRPRTDYMHVGMRRMSVMRGGSGCTYTHDKVLRFPYFRGFIPRSS